MNVGCWGYKKKKNYAHYLHFVTFCCLGQFYPISCRVTSLALGQSYDCPSASEVTLKDRNSQELVI